MFSAIKSLFGGPLFLNLVKMDSCIMARGKILSLVVTNHRSRLLAVGLKLGTFIQITCFRAGSVLILK